jgi:CheY-like chemotaxis protein
MIAHSLGVIIAEDDEGHATLMRRNLKRAGLEIDPVHVRDGQEALDYMYRRAPWADRARHGALVLLLDLNMPRLGGLEVLRQLKNDAELGRIPVFVLTTTDDPAEVDRCYTLGASACIVKPVEYAAFSEAVQRLAQFLMTAAIPGEISSPPSPHGR